MSDLLKKEQQAIRLLKSMGDKPIEVSYSGGKDSDVILALVQMAGINYRAIYKNTTIDPPGTIQHCLDVGAEILRPKLTFFQLVERKGFPSRFARFCCEKLKEYKVMDDAVHGVRRSESTARAKRYKEPVICRFYTKKEKVNVLLPILEWTDEDVREFIEQNHIQCAPHYYDAEGRFHVERRLGCMGCPLRADRGLATFRERPKLVKAWLRGGQKWLNAPREKPNKTQQECRDVYEYFYRHLFCSSKAEWEAAKHTLFGYPDFKALLEDYFGIDLTI